jgi:hypothetical protein
MGILDGTRSAAAARPQENNNHTFKIEIAQTTHDGTNVLAIDTSNTCSNTPPSLQINRTSGNSPKVCRGTTNSRASNFSNTVSMNSKDTRPRHNGSPPPHALANYIAPREVVGRSPRRYIALMPNHNSLTGGNSNSFHTNSPQPKTSLPWPLNVPDTNHTNDMTQP